MKGNDFMFDIENKTIITKLINMRDDNQIIMPLYVQIYNKRYSLLELKDVDFRFTKGCFKIGYGTADSLFMKNSFPIKRIHDFDIIDVFTEFDDDNNVDIRYMVFETGDVDNVDNDLNEQIDYYFNLLYDYTWNISDGNIRNKLMDCYD